jgi:S-DNA-T family DNA segregation ATPase FtsK/SpoIIIE
LLVDDQGGRTPLGFGTTAVDDAAVLVDGRITVRRNRPGPVAVNGSPVFDAVALTHGDLLRTSGGLRTVVIESPLPAQPQHGAHQPHRGAAPWTSAGELPDRPPVTLPEPPGAVRRPRLPLLSASVPLLMGLGLWLVTRSVASVVFVLFSGVFVLASSLESRRDARAERQFRDQEFTDALADSSDELARRAGALQALAHQRHPSARDQLPDTAGPRLWGRTDLSVRLGTGPVAVDGLLTPPSVGRRAPRAAEVHRLAEQFGAIVLPVTVDLAATGGLVLTGDPVACGSVARTVTMQLACAQGPDRLGLTVHPPAPWSPWLPHLSGANPGPTAAGATTVHVRGPGSIDDGARPVLWWAGTAAPDHVDAVLVLAGDGTGVLRRPGRPDQSIITETLGERHALAGARALAPLVPADPDGAATTPDQVQLRDVLGRGSADLLTDPLATQRRWAEGAQRGDLLAPLGRTGSATVHLDLRADGPHALVAGTTGAGKSELLRTLVASLALHHGPDRCTFLLVDYKGGAAFGPLDALPHVVGTVTDLDETLAARALTALRAEVRRRERVAAGGEAAPPALVVVVDEFAALSRELPQFVDGLVDVAQRGRSLGIHLVLATQHPRGVVSDAIRANAGLRLALRTADPEASTDVVDTEQAAALPRSTPGRVVVRTGPGATSIVQTAWTGGPAAAPPRALVIPLGSASSPVSDGPTELEAVVAVVTAAAAHLPSPRRPWCDPLPARLDATTLPAGLPPGQIALGLVDRPEEQRTLPLVVDLATDGGLAVVGAPGSGRSTALRTFVLALAAQTNDVVQVDVVDTGTTLRDLEHLDVVGSVIGLADTERTLRLLRGLAAEVERRRTSGDDGVRRVLVIDGLSAFEQLHERTSRGLALQLLSRIAADGPANRVHVAVSARRPVEVDAALGASLRCRVQLRPVHADEAALLGLPTSAADPSCPPGRGHIGPHQIQVSTPPATPTGSTFRAHPVPTLPDLARGQLAASPSDPWLVPVGLHADTLEVIHLNLSYTHGVVAGTRRSGVTTAMWSLAARVDAYRVLVSDRPDATDVERWDLVLDPTQPDLVDRLDAVLRSDHRRAIVAVDGTDRLLEGVGGRELDDVLSSCAPTPGSSVRILFGGDADLLNRCCADAWTRARAGRTGLLLRVDPDLHGALLHADLPRRDELAPRPGRGWCVGPDGADPLQVFLPPDPQQPAA